MYAIAHENKVRPDGAHVTADDEIVKWIINTLKWKTSVPDDNVQETVPNGRVTLGAKLRGAVTPTWLSNSAMMQYSPSHSMISVAGLRFHFFLSEAGKASVATMANAGDGTEIIEQLVDIVPEGEEPRLAFFAGWRILFADLNFRFLLRNNSVSLCYGRARFWAWNFAWRGLYRDGYQTH